MTARIAYESGNVGFLNREIEFKMQGKAIQATVYEYVLNPRKERYIDSSKISFLNESQICFNKARYSLRYPRERQENLILVSRMPGPDKQWFLSIVKGLRVEEETIIRGKLTGITLVS